MKKLLSVACALASLSLAAETFALKSVPTSLDDWKNGSFYTNGVAPTGVSTDVVVIPARMTVTVSSSDVVAFLGGMSNVKVTRANATSDPIAVLIFDIAEGETVEYPGQLASEGDGSYSYVQKKGKGVMKLLHTSNEAYRSRWVISEGELWLPPIENDGKSYYKYWGATIIEKDGTLRTDSCTGGKSIWQPAGVYNGGTVRNDTGTATTIYLQYDWRSPQGVAEDGKFLGLIYIDARSSFISLLGDQSTYTSTLLLDGSSVYGARLSEVYVSKFGKKADAASSLGTSEPAVGFSGNVGGRLIYTGHGETTDKNIRAIAGGSSTVATNELCGGEYGGLKLTGSLTKYDTSTVWNPLIVLSGDHANACTFAMSNEDFTHGGSVEAYKGVTYVRYIKKAGTGEWYFPFNKNYTSGGTVEINDGTLAYEALYEKGRICSLGKATRCYDAAAAQPTEDRRVPYAILLGGDREGQTGMLESRTNGIQQCTDRPFGLKGRGGFRANCGPVRYANVFGVGANAKTLVLDGANEAENMVCDIRDGAGTVSVEKNGSNTWVLGGDQTFTGSLTVNGGTLVVRRPAQQYRRYRLLVKEIADNNTEVLKKMGRACGKNNQVTICEIGLWDANNRRVNMNLRYRANHLAMQPGEFDFGWSLTPPDSTIRKFELLFDGNRYTAEDSRDGKVWGAVSSTAFTTREGTTNPGAKLNDPLTWIPIDMYLADGEMPVDHFDVMSGDSEWGGDKNLWDPKVPTDVLLQASVDGVHWDDVSDDCSFTHVNTRYQWLGGNVSGSGANGSKDNGYAGQNSPDTAFFNSAYGWKTTKTAPTKVFSLLENVGPVTVANGATLKYEGAADGAPALSQVKLAAGATGSIDGFAFAEDGTFEIDAMAKGSVSVGVTLPNATGLGNVANWQVKVGNVLKPSYRVKATANGFTVTKSGMTVIIR